VEYILKLPFTSRVSGPIGVAKIPNRWFARLFSSALNVEQKKSPKTASFKRQE
jgi:hypothetical protein